MEECKDIMVIDWATRIPTDAEEEYLSHLFCLGGGCWYRFNGMDFELHAGDLSIIRKRKMIENIEVSMGFCAKIIYVKSGFVELCNLRAIMEWKDNWPFPQLCHAPLAWTADCLSSRSWTAWVVYQGYWTSFLPWNAYQRHADGYPWFFRFSCSYLWWKRHFNADASIIHRFLRMLEDGTYREHREVSYYVDCLCITSKYLSEVLKKVSRYAANYWINRYTIFDISRLLSDKSLSFVQISDMFSFSSQAYLSRYVQQNLGFNPTEYRT